MILPVCGFSLSVLVNALTGKVKYYFTSPVSRAIRRVDAKWSW
jgi:hypothetical protein